jgi:hypothetical protein
MAVDHPRTLLMRIVVLRVLNRIEKVDTSQPWVALIVIGFFGTLITASTLLELQSIVRVSRVVTMRRVTTGRRPIGRPSLGSLRPQALEVEVL